MEIGCRFFEITLRFHFHRWRLRQKPGGGVERYCNKCFLGYTGR